MKNLEQILDSADGPIEIIRHYAGVIGSEADDILAAAEKKHLYWSDRSTWTCTIPVSPPIMYPSVHGTYMSEGGRECAKIAKKIKDHIGNLTPGIRALAGIADKWSGAICDSSSAETYYLRVLMGLYGCAPVLEGVAICASPPAERYLSAYRHLVPSASA